MIAAVRLFFVLLLPLLLGLAVLPVAPAAAASPQTLMITKAATAKAPPAAAPATPPPATLTPEQVDGYMAGLTDEQARAQLREQLRAEAQQRQQAAETEESPRRKEGFSALAHSVQTRLQRLKDRALEAREKARNADSYATLMLMTLTDQEGWPAVGRGVAVFALLLALGGLAEWGFRRALSAIERRIATTLAMTPLRRFGVFATLLLFDALALIVFLAVATAPSFAFYTQYDPLRVVIITFLLAVVATRAVYLVARRLLVGRFRLFPVSDAFGRALSRWITIIAALLAFDLSALPTMQLLGLPEVLARCIGLPIGTLILVLTIVMVWQMRARLMRERAGTPGGQGETVASGTAGHAAYFVFATAYAIVVYAAAAEKSFLGVKGEALLAYFSLIFVLAAPSIVGLLARAFEQLSPPQSVVIESAAGESAGVPPPVPPAERMKDALLAGTYALILGLAFAMLAEAWFGGVFAWFESPRGEKVENAILTTYVTSLLAYVAWQLVRTWAERHLGEDEAARRTGAFEDEATSVPTRSRMATLAPLIRAAMAITLAAAVIMIVLSAIGIDIAPLLAGAGVVGLAVGFGAQSLVRDILSGAFFLIDDAFRVGEYIEVDNNLRGEVERITIRSMQLRHHRGPLLTLPYGNLRSIINHNRDFAIFKQEFRVPYDTDLEKVRKIIKTIGQDLLADPEYGPKFLEPLKSQGVIRIEESALIIRTKFVSKPREQFVLRRVVFQRVQEAFHAAGIEFAVRKVFVHVDHDDDDEAGKAASGGAAIAALASDEQARRAKP